MKVESLWPGYLKSGYFDQEGNLRAEFVLRENVGKLARQVEIERLTTGQLRRFFGHARGIEQRLKLGQQTWESLRPEFLKLDVAAEDARGKKPSPKIPEIFYDFIKRNVAAVKTEREFLRGFLPHFEALVGFCSGKLSDRS